MQRPGLEKIILIGPVWSHDHHVQSQRDATSEGNIILQMKLGCFKEGWLRKVVLAQAAITKPQTEWLKQQTSTSHSSGG